MSANELLLILGGIVVGVGLAALVFALARPVRPKRPQKTNPQPLMPSGSPAPAGDRTTFTINGVSYHSLDDIPDPQIRQTVETALRHFPR